MTQAVEAIEPIERLDVAAAELMANYPPRWWDSNKRLVADLSCPAGAAHQGRLGYSRWAAMALPVEVDLPGATAIVEPRPGYFDYRTTLETATVVEWHVNFADPHLFAAYGSSLFAQDEMQVTEHPALGALREAVVAAGLAAVTVEANSPTPVLVTGVERRCRVETAPDAAAGRPDGLYGNAFARADPAVVRASTTVLDPPSITNLVAIAAPSGGRGKYRREEIQAALVTAFTGFRAAYLESHRLRHPDTIDVVVHTGYWGCGAFGGNRALMAILQIAAARAAEIDRLVFHTGPPGGEVPLAQAFAMLQEPAFTTGPHAIIKVVDDLVARGFQWGVSDGN